ncbi:MAG: glycosyltransferase family 2 protein [Candidatus Microgenomates bacterium]|jgi:glycosyltransferase involved in cell wall biosynthesis
MKIFVVIPLFNEEKHIAKVLKEVSRYKLPIVVIDDGSSDSSASAVQNTRLKNLVFLKHKVNLGKGAAMKTGADYVFDHGANAAIFMDSDGQHQAADLPKFIKMVKSGKYDVVFGSRNYTYGVPLVRFLGNKFASVLMSMTFKVYVSDVLCGFKGLTKEAYEKLRWNSPGYGVETEIVARVGRSQLPFCEVPIGTVYHDKVKGVTILDAFGILADVVGWKFTL